MKYACGFPECAAREAQLAEFRALLIELRSWMDDIEMGEWDAKFCAKIDAALAPHKREAE